MLRDSAAFSGFSVNDTEAAKAFYGDTLGLDVDEMGPGILTVKFASGGQVIMYPKPNHEAATFTVLNFPVADIEAAVDDLAAKGVTFERYDEFEQDDRGIARDPDGPAIAWFKDPAGNILSVLEQS